MHPNASQKTNTRTQETLDAKTLAREQALTDLRATFHGTPAGQRTLRRLRAASGVDLPRFRDQGKGQPLDPLLAAYYDGQASIYLQLAGDLRAAGRDPETEPDASEA